MKLSVATVAIFFLVILPRSICHADGIVKLSPHVSFQQGAVNGVFVEKNGQTLVIYGDPGAHLQKADKVLFTHSRRDLVWAGRKLVENGAESVVPLGEVENFTKVADFWSSFDKSRYHNYTQRTTKILTRPLRVDRMVRDGDVLRWQDIAVDVLDTPGYTKGSVSYFMNVDGLRYGLVGDIIYGDGQLMDLYSLQEAVSEEARIGGYHGYAGRIGELIESLRKIVNQKPDILVPARGPVIRDPKAAIERLIQRLKAVYKNYLSINSLHWLRKDVKNHYEALAARVLGPGAEVNWMPFAEIIEKEPPSWIIVIRNSRLILSENGSGFLIDCGFQSTLDELIKLKKNGRLSGLDGLFITHYHDDHTDKVSEVAREFGCPVYACEGSKDILENPGAYRLPALTIISPISFTVAGAIALQST